MVIVGRDGLEDGDDWRRIQDFAAQGGRALILRHERNPEGGLLRLAAGGGTIAFPRRPSHPILANVSKEELRFWRPDNLVIDKPLIKPDSGLYKVLIDAGSAEGLKYAGLMELEVGSGTILLSQLDLLAKLDSEPVTRKLLQNILNYLAGYQPRSERQFQLVQATPEERQIFQAIGFDIEEPEPTPIAGDQLIFASGEVDRVRLANLLERVEQGSILWLHKPSADVLERLSDFQLDITTQVPPPSLRENASGSVLLRVASPFTPGKETLNESAATGPPSPARASTDRTLSAHAMAAPIATGCSRARRPKGISVG